VYAEGFRRPDRLREVAERARERRTPIVVLKVGRSENAREATLAHTGTLAGTPEIVDAVLRQSGIIQVTSLNEMLDTLALLAAARHYRGGWRVTVVSGLGGECGRAADAADRAGIELPALSPRSVASLRSFMPDFANPRNPLDGTGAMYESAEIFPRMIDTALHDENTDVLAINMRANVPEPGGWAPSRGYARAIVEAMRAGTDRLVVCFTSFAGADLDQEVVAPLAGVGVPYLESTDTAMLALCHAREHRRFLERPGPVGSVPGDRIAARTSPPDRNIPAGGPGLLDNSAALRLLREFGIPVVETRAVKDAREAVEAARSLGYPVVLKVDSPDLAHKTDVGGVRLGCGDATAVETAAAEILSVVRRRAPHARIRGLLVQRTVTGGIEMIVGIKSDALFGPAVVCGFGGIFAEVLRDVTVRVPPLARMTAHEMIAELRGIALLSGARGRAPADIPALPGILVQLATLAEAHRNRLRALDINPLVVLEEGRGAVAVDWLVELS
jgi:acetyltransferase